MDLSRYRKALVALVGAAALFLPELAGFDEEIGGVFDLVVGLLTAFGVYQVKNEPQPLRPDPDVLP